MLISPSTKIGELLDKYDFMLDFLTSLSPRFKLLKNPIARKTVGGVATLGQASSLGGIPLDLLIDKIASEIERRTGEKVSKTKEGQSEVITDPAVRQEILKDIIKDLHEGAEVKDVKARFQELIKGIDASEISAMEQKLMEEGMPESEIKRLCDVHVQVFKETLEEKEPPEMPAGHPIHTFMLENRACEEIINRLDTITKELGPDPDEASFTKKRVELEDLISKLQKIDLHFLRKENQLFPALEKHDITGPTQVMWSIDDDIRKMLKDVKRLVEASNGSRAVANICEVTTTIRDMIYKEERILFPLAAETLDTNEWIQVRKGEEEIGYAWIEAPSEMKVEADHSAKVVDQGASIKLDMGFLSAEQINLLFKHLPVDISFVDENDEVAYYSDTPERIFPRSAGVIGRKVQKCHPPKSVHVVQEILDDFKAGVRSVAEFWIQSQGNFIHIRYFAVRDALGAYRGCMEVAQDVTEIRKLDGEKRLLD